MCLRPVVGRPASLLAGLCFVAQPVVLLAVRQVAQELLLGLLGPLEQVLQQVQGRFFVLFQVMQSDEPDRVTVFGCPRQHLYKQNSDRRGGQ